MSTDLIGQMLGPYQIIEFTGMEGPAESFKGYDPDRGIPVLVRLVGRGIPAEPVWSARFRRETKVIAGLKHANIAPILDVGEALDGHYLVSELIEGTTLAHLLIDAQRAGRALLPDDVSFMVRQIAAGLDEAHTKGAVHRDVNPHRILITRSGHAILTDFGLAILLSRDAAEEAAGTAYGLPEYMAPEVAADLRQASPASDIYSLGAILYEIVTGVPPHMNPTDQEVDTYSGSNGDLDHALLTNNVPPTVAHTIKTALAASPKDRFKNAMQLAEQLEWAYHNPNASLDRPRKRAKTLESVPVSVDTGAAALSSGSERVVVKRGPSLMDERREKARLRAEHRKLQQEQRKAEQAARRQEQAEAARKFFGKWGRTFVVLVLFTGIILGILYALRSMGILNVSVVVPTVEVGVQSPFVTPTQIEVGEATTEPALETSPTIEPVEITTPTVVEQGSLTPAPPVEVTPLVVGSSALRIVDGGIMQFVPAGEFQMGTNDLNFSTNARPQHTVKLSAYWIDQTEVTNVQYSMCVKSGVCSNPTKVVYYANADYADFPVTFVDHNQATAYCLWLATQTGQILGLPTEAQWEKAAAWNPATNTLSLYPWGDAEPSDELARYVYSADGRPASPVGTRPKGASAYGALDMAGNVWEWTADWFDPAYYQREGVAEDPTGPINGVDRVTRGGSWRVAPELLVVLKRNPARPDISGDSLGFRCALMADYPTVDSGIALTPLDAVRVLSERLAQNQELDQALRDQWVSALQDINLALASGDNAGARALASTQLSQPGLSNGPARASAWQLKRAIEWMLSQLPEAAEPIATDTPALDVTPVVTPSQAP